MRRPPRRRLSLLLGRVCVPLISCAWHCVLVCYLLLTSLLILPQRVSDDCSMSLSSCILPRCTPSYSCGHPSSTRATNNTGQRGRVATTTQYKQRGGGWMEWVKGTKCWMAKYIRRATPFRLRRVAIDLNSPQTRHILMVGRWIALLLWCSGIRFETLWNRGCWILLCVDKEIIVFLIWSLSSCDALYHLNPHHPEI